MPSRKLSTIMRTLVCWFAVCFATAIYMPSAQAAFHLWNLQQIYTNSHGNLQFIELFTSASSQNFVSGQQIDVSNIGNTQTHTLSLPHNLIGSTPNHDFLIGTAGLHAAGGPIPDFIMPDNFLFSGGGAISFFGANSGPYLALPTNGVLARAWNAGDVPNSPQNFAGQVGLVPEPTSFVLLACGGIGVFYWLHRRRVA